MAQIVIDVEDRLMLRLQQQANQSGTLPRQWLERLVIQHLSQTRSDFMDTSPVIIEGVESDDGYISARDQIEISVVLDEDQQYLAVSFPVLGMELSAKSRQELILMIDEDLEFLWRNIVSCADDLLAQDAMAVKQWMTQYFDRGSDAA